jgi:hypothetical protein
MNCIMTATHSQWSRKVISVSKFQKLNWCCCGQKQNEKNTQQKQEVNGQQIIRTVIHVLEVVVLLFLC